MKIYLLTHQREVDRKTNTGKLALESTDGLVERIIWERTKPNKKLVKLIESESVALLYPHSGSNEQKINDCEHIVILDATWQEAKKIYNQSNYLKSANKLNIPISKASSYRLRRNQPIGGLCTIECIIEILKHKDQEQLADNLEQMFLRFNQTIQ